MATLGLFLTPVLYGLLRRLTGNRLLTVLRLSLMCLR